SFEIKHALDVAQGDVQHHAQTARQALEEPDMRDRAGQLDMGHALTADLGKCDFNTTFFADDTTVLESLVLAAQALIVLGRPENLRAEQAVALGLEGTVIDGFRLLDLAIGPGTNFFRGSQRNLDRVELF